MDRIILIHSFCVINIITKDNEMYMRKKITGIK